MGYLPAIITLLLNTIALILYATVIAEHTLNGYIVVSIMPILPFAIIFANRKWKLGIPSYLIMLVCIHLVLSADLGTVMQFYPKIWWWDLFIHGMFGTIGCAAFYELYIRYEKKQPKWLHYIAFVLLTISLAALWEIYEFVADLFLHSDMQGVESAIEKGISPLTDTITDIMIAIVGAIVFYVVLWIKDFVKDKKAENSQDKE